MGVAVNVTLVPEQIVVALAPMVTDGEAVELTVIVIALEAILAGVAQTMDDVITTATTSLLASVEF